MLLSRKEMTFDFHGHKLNSVRDRELLGWIMNQFLYGEITGIQIGHWLFRAPSLEAARFLARQAVEEFQHVDNFLRILRNLECTPAPPHLLVRFLATGMMGHSWPEHVALEMAAGEGFVLMAFYAVIDTLDHSDIVSILQRAVHQEERHVAFGEAQTQQLIQARPFLRRHLLGLNLVWAWGVRRLGRLLAKHLPDHPLLQQLPSFVDHALYCHDLRLQRIGLIQGSLASLPPWKKAALVTEAYVGKALSALWRFVTWPLRLFGLGRSRRLTDSYLDDPAIRNFI